MQQIYRRALMPKCDFNKGQYTYDVHENWPIFKTPHCKVNNFICVKLGTHTSFVLWITYFLHCNWYLFVLWIFLLWITCFSSLYLKTVKKNYIAKCDSVEGLFIDYFCLIIWYSTWSCLSCYYFSKGKNGVYKPLFFKTFHSVF